MRVILTLLTNFLALLGYFLTYISKKKLAQRKSLLIILGAILTSVVIWGKYYYEGEESESVKKEFRGIKGQNEQLLNKNDSLKTLAREILESNKDLTLLLEPFRDIAHRKYPSLKSEKALEKLASDISRMQPRLVFLQDKTVQYQDPLTDLLHTHYLFRSQYPIGLTDVQIKIRFDARFLSAISRIQGAIVEEQGTKMRIDADSSGFVYTTGYLREGNDIIINVVSRTSLKISSIELSP